MAIPLGLVIVPGGIAIGVAAAGGTPNQTTPTKLAPGGGVLSATGATSSGATVGQIIATPTAPIGGGTRSKLSMINMGSAATGVVGVSPTSGWGSLVSPTNGLDAALQQKLDEIKALGKSAYEKLSASAKKAGAEVLNKELGLDPPLTGDESWEEILKRSAAPAAAKGGEVLGAAFGGPAGAALGKAVGAYLGGKIEDLIAKNSDEIKQWFEDRWQSIEDVYEDVEDAVQDAIDYIGGWF